MRRVIGWIVGILVVAFVAIQFRTIDRTNPPATSELEIPADVAPVVKRACFDCHSNQTRWPWYANVAPASWFLADHVKDGRKHLNFSEWPTGDARKERHAFHEIVEVLEEGEMPLASYTWIHRDAKLNQGERDRLIAWAGAARDAIPGGDTGADGGEEGEHEDHEGHDH